MQQTQMQHIVMGSTSVSAAQETPGVFMQYNEPPPSDAFEPDQYLRTDNFDVKPRFDVNARYNTISSSEAFSNRSFPHASRPSAGVVNSKVRILGLLE